MDGALPLPCPSHSGLAARLDAVAADVAEIKGDIKNLLSAAALQRGYSAVGKTFAVGFGLATPLAALLWALIRAC